MKEKERKEKEDERKEVKEKEDERERRVAEKACLLHELQDSLVVRLRDGRLLIDARNFGRDGMLAFILAKKIQGDLALLGREVLWVLSYDHGP